MHRRLLPSHGAVVAFLLPLLVACSGPDPEPSPPCERKCQDANAMRALRETLKLVFNLTLQGNPVGPQDETTLCPMGGSGRVFGQATANAIQGAIEVDLTYELTQCAYLQRDEDPPENYDMTLTGTVLQQGTIAVQPSVTTALNMSSEAVTFSGNVYDPPIEYNEDACPVVLGQNGNHVSGTICEREAGVSF
jgi:hypothetical protein